MNNSDGGVFFSQFKTGGLSNRVSGGRAGRVGEFTKIFFLPCLALPGLCFWLQYIPDERKAMCSG